MSNAPSIAPDSSAADLIALQGNWTQTYLEVDGIPNPTDEYSAPGAVTTITGHNFCVRRATGEVMLEGTFELDATTQPKSITWIDSIGPDAGKRLPASYELDHDSFTFIAADEGAARPLLFHTTPGLTMRRLARHTNRYPPIGEQISTRNPLRSRT